MIEHANAVTHEVRLSSQESKWKDHEIKHHGDQRFANARRCQMQLFILPPKQCALPPVPALTALGRNDFIRYRFVAPDKTAAALYHAPKKILVFTTVSEFFLERLSHILQYLSAKQRIAG